MVAQLAGRHTRSEEVCFRGEGVLLLLVVVVLMVVGVLEFETQITALLPSLCGHCVRRPNTRHLTTLDLKAEG